MGIMDLSMTPSEKIAFLASVSRFQALSAAGTKACAEQAPSALYPFIYFA
jgi:hypothetical protein